MIAIFQLAKPQSAFQFPNAIAVSHTNHHEAFIHFRLHAQFADLPGIRCQASLTSAGTSVCDERAGNFRQRKIIRRDDATNSRRDRMCNIRTECCHITETADFFPLVGCKMCFCTVFQNTQTMLFRHSHDCIHLTRLSECMHWNRCDRPIRDVFFHFRSIHVIRNRIYIHKYRLQTCMNTRIRCCNESNRRNENFAAVFPAIDFLHCLQANMQGGCSTIAGNTILLVMKSCELFLELVNHLSLRKSPGI